MDRTGTVMVGRGILAFVLAALPLALLPTTCAGESDGAFGVWGSAVWLGLLAAGLLGGAQLRGWSGAAIVIGGMAVGLLIRLAAGALSAWGLGGIPVCGTDIDRTFLVASVPFAFMTVLGYGIARSLAGSVETGGRLP